MRTCALTVAAAAAACALGASPAVAAQLCVGDGPGCFATVRGAVALAHDGDTIRIEPGVYRGGVTIGVDVSLRGAGLGRTRIAGGGPVITIDGASPAVQISGVTLSDGVTTAFDRPAEAFGGGLLVRRGASVTVADSVIEDNVAAPLATTSSQVVQCPDGNPCPYANGSGGGIYNLGTLELVRTVVRHNRAGIRPGAPAMASDAEGGGIFSDGPLMLVDSKVVDNEARAVEPIGRFADGGGVFSKSGGVTVRRTTIAGNRAILHSSWPTSVEHGTVAGGLHVTDTSEATIERAIIARNELILVNTIGDAVAFGGGIHADGPVVMRDTEVIGNRVQTTARGGHGFASADSGAGDFTAATTITGCRFLGNRATALAPAGSALAAAGALFPAAGDGLELTHSLVSGNRVTAVGGEEATARGGGIQNGAMLNVERAVVTHNAVRAQGTSGLAQGGGIWSGRVAEAGNQEAHLTMFDAAITANALLSSPGIDVAGGGLFSDAAPTLTRVRIVGNRPDQCEGC